MINFHCSVSFVQLTWNLKMGRLNEGKKERSSEMWWRARAREHIAASKGCHDLKEGGSLDPLLSDPIHFGGKISWLCLVITEADRGANGPLHLPVKWEETAAGKASIKLLAGASERARVAAAGVRVSAAAVRSLSVFRRGNVPSFIGQSIRLFNSPYMRRRDRGRDGTFRRTESRAGCSY